jgi:hypothetical protein
MWLIAPYAVRSIEGPYSLCQLCKQYFSFRAIRDEIKMFHLLTYNPVCHRVDIITDDIAAQAIGFKHGRTSPHEGIGHAPAGKAVCLEVKVTKRTFTKLCEE